MLSMVLRAPCAGLTLATWLFSGTGCHSCCPNKVSEARLGRSDEHRVWPSSVQVPISALPLANGETVGVSFVPFASLSSSVKRESL